MRFSGLILAAGLSERMKMDKAFLPFNSELTFIEKLIKEYVKAGALEIVVVVNSTFQSKINFISADLLKCVKLVVNDQLELGRFNSIQLGLMELTSTPTFVQNVDNPFVNFGLILNLSNGLTNSGYAVPVYKKRGGHPILLSKQIIPSLINDYKPHEQFNKVLMNFGRGDVEVEDPYITANINTQEDYQKYFPGLRN